MKISYSRASSYLHCPQAHYLGYIRGLRLNKPERPLQFGSDFHKLLEYRTDKSKLKTAFKEIQETYYDMPSTFQSELGDNYLEDLKTIFGDYRKVWKDRELPIETEHEFMIEVGKFQGEEVYFHGIIDEVYDGLVMGEHKTFTQPPNMGILAMNMQTCLYSKAWELETGKKFERVMWDYIKSAPAAYPIWLDKSGRFSAAKSDKITPYSWARACKEKGIEDEEILRQGQIYQPNIGNYFFRCYTELLPSMVDSVWEDFKEVVKDIIKRGHKNKMKNISRNCTWCGFRPICYAEFTGADVDYIIETDYKIREERK